MVEVTRRAGANLPFSTTTEYINTIPPGQEAKSPGDSAMEWRIRSLIRWNAMAMVVAANRKPGDLGGHIATFGSSATLYDVGFNHFWRAPSEEHPGDLVYIQGHGRSEEHTSELQSLMRISYAVFCLKKKTKKAAQEQT